MKYLITESKLDKVVSMYLDNQDFVVIKKRNYIFFVNSEGDEYAQIEFNKKDGFIRIFRWGYPGKNRKIDLYYTLKDVEAIRVELKQGLDSQRTIYLKLKGNREIPITGIGQPLTLKEIEKQASELANFLKVSLEGL